MPGMFRPIADKVVDLDYQNAVAESYQLYTRICRICQLQLWFSPAACPTALLWDKRLHINVNRLHNLSPQASRFCSESMQFVSRGRYIEDLGYQKERL
jgi:hypothetical protein